MATRKGFRLTTKMNMLTISMILVSVSVLSTLMVRNEFNHLYADLTNQGRILMGMVVRNAEYGIYTEDREGLGTLLDTLAVEPDVVFAVVVDLNGRVLAERRDGEVPSEAFPAAKSPLEQYGEGTTARSGVSVRRQRDFLEFHEAVFSQSSFEEEGFFRTEQERGEELIGGVRLVLETSSARKRVSSYISQVFTMTLLLLLFGIGMTLLLTRRVLAPIGRLKEAAEHVAAGQLNQLVEVQSSDEIADLSSSFNDMVNHLTISRQQIDARTEELVESNRKMQREMEARKHLEEQLLHSQKMEAIGHLAGGVAHDFNNILMAILSFATLLKMEMKEEGLPGTYVADIISSAERAAQLTQNLLAFSRKKVLHPEPVDINDSVKNAGRMLSRLLGEHIEQRVILFEGTLQVLADRIQMEQVVINLATNARDAMPRGGVLTIETGRKEFDEAFVKMHGYGQPGAYVEISVSDTGEGMSNEIRKNIFEPFFTTKDVNKGTGLGLSIVYGIIKQHGGYVDVYSEQGKGSRFSVYLPLAKDAPAARSTGEAERESLRGSETILLAEDEAKLRSALKTFFTLHGYSVLEAANGEEAVEQFESHRESIQVLVFDIMMPLKTGKAAYEEIRNMRPDVKVIFMSGYSDKVFPAGVSIGKNVPILMKPISPLELLGKVREVLGRADGDRKGPMAGEHVPAPARAASEKPSGTYRGSVLVAEDNSSVSQVIQKFLSVLGPQVDAVSHGREALEAIEKKRYDLVFMDIVMPVMDGLEAAEEIRRRESEDGKSRLPLLAMTGTKEEDMRDEILAAGFDDCLTKPFGLESLEQVLLRWLPGGAVKKQGVGKDNGGGSPSGKSPGSDSSAVVNPRKLEEIRSLESLGSPGLLGKVVTLYLGRAAELMEEVRTALGRGDHAALAAAAHELKSSSANVGSEQLADLSGQLENLAGKGSLEGTEELFVQIEAEHQRVVVALSPVAATAST